MASAIGFLLLKVCWLNYLQRLDPPSTHRNVFGRCFLMKSWWFPMWKGRLKHQKEGNIKMSCAIYDRTYSVVMNGGDLNHEESVWGSEAYLKLMVYPTPKFDGWDMLRSVLFSAIFGKFIRAPTPMFGAQNHSRTEANCRPWNGNNTLETLTYFAGFFSRS